MFTWKYFFTLFLLIKLKFMWQKMLAWHEVPEFGQYQSRVGFKWIINWYFFRTSVYKQSCQLRSQPNLIGSCYFIRVITHQWLYYAFLEWLKVAFLCQFIAHTTPCLPQACALSSQGVGREDVASQVHWTVLLVLYPWEEFVMKLFWLLCCAALRTISKVPSG